MQPSWLTITIIIIRTAKRTWRQLAMKVRHVLVEKHSMPNGQCLNKSYVKRLHKI